MTNKEKYQRAFGTLHASHEFLMEARNMNNQKRHSHRRMLSLCAAVMLVLAMAAVCYAENVGGIQREIQLWIHGDQTDAVIEIEDGSYTLTYEDAEGLHERGGGGVAIDFFGRERPLTEEELLEQLSMPEVEYREDGTVHWTITKVKPLYEVSPCTFPAYEDTSVSARKRDLDELRKKRSEVWKAQALERLHNKP